jgi:cell division control protein 24
VDRELRNEALADLCARVDDWKNHRVDHFGDLLLHGHFPVVTGKSDLQKEVGALSFNDHNEKDQVSFQAQGAVARPA